MKNQGTERYYVGDLWYRSIISVIREKLSNTEDIRQFHYYPYRALWQPTPSITVGSTFQMLQQQGSVIFSGTVMGWVIGFHSEELAVDCRLSKRMTDDQHM